jgi:hypothetical protein
MTRTPTFVRTGSRLIACAWLHVAVAALALPAVAQPTVAVLGLSSETQDEDLARSLTDKVRAKVAGSAKWTLSSTSASLDQVMMVHDCESVDDACLAKVAGGLGVEQLVYGKVMRGAGSAAPRAEVNLYAPSGSRTASADITDTDALDPVAASLVQQLSGTPEPEPEPVAPVATAPVPEAPEDEEDAESPVPEDDSPTSLKWLGYALVGVSVASVGVVVFSWTQINAASDNAAFERYRRNVGERDPTVTDVCDAADAGLSFEVDAPTFNEVRDQCSRGKTFETLQYVFLATAIVAGGAGAYVLLTDDSSESASASRRLALRPAVGVGGASVTAALRF